MVNKRLLNPLAAPWVCNLDVTEKDKEEIEILEHKSHKAKKSSDEINQTLMLSQKQNEEWVEVTKGIKIQQNNFTH